MGKSTRQVQQMLAEVDPEAAAPAERLRALGDGRWELKAVIDTECQRGLQQLRELLSHVDPHLTLGQLVGRLVREGVARYDPSRPPRRKRRKSDPASDECSAGTAGRETTDRVAVAAENPRRAEKSAAPTSPSAPKRSAKPTAVGASPAVLPARGGPAEASSKRRLEPPPVSGTSAPKCVAPRAKHAASPDGAVATEPTSAAKPRVAAGSLIPEQSAHGAGSAELTATAKLGVAGGSIPDRSAGSAGSAGRTAAAKPGKPSGRSIPAAVKREVWRRDQGCCTYVDRHTGLSASGCTRYAIRVSTLRVAMRRRHRLQVNDFPPLSAFAPEALSGLDHRGQVGDADAHPMQGRQLKRQSCMTRGRDRLPN